MENHGFAPSAVELISQCYFPGNVREPENCVLGVLLWMEPIFRNVAMSSTSSHGPARCRFGASAPA
ncbi:MAG: hypothetical protein EOR93_30215 [Mesorhizobium sp.]|nr:hypothetical protein EJ079_09760 [Mesorhizobium sp. M7A.F.Ce.TU.012.03.2.1]RUV17069.1 hypothetical protein EOB80_28705 [Mesorhizobium sp. M7A.F.Ca.MR.245.00.0.0]RUV34139.1 hypothetical protein EOB49_27265 [Mesorhizobium sp. M7A.F.Ca.MR.148.00.0.0]RUV47481.1 hypothetical protein EOB77_27880 [Mesorhizobium sp. M7A.F.Ca.MR.228.00.0.0]RWN08979.1 MAG: hypothetical protein EOR94_30505 [Mesorhizobium sp.]